jgi:hypothetical protein
MHPVVLPVQTQSGRVCHAKPGDVRQLSCPQGRRVLWCCTLTQGGAPPRVGACPGLISFAPLGRLLGFRPTSSAASQRVHSSAPIRLPILRNRRRVRLVVAQAQESGDRPGTGRQLSPRFVFEGMADEWGQANDGIGKTHFASRQSAKVPRFKSRQDLTGRVERSRGMKGECQ